MALGPRHWAESHTHGFQPHTGRSSTPQLGTLLDDFVDNFAARVIVTLSGGCKTAREKRRKVVEIAQMILIAEEAAQPGEKA